MQLDVQMAVQISERDTYLTTPTCIRKWINMQDSLNTTQKYLLQTITADALRLSYVQVKKKVKESPLLTQLSHSVLTDLTAIKERTLISSIQKLIKEGFLEVVEQNNNGTVYLVNIPSSVSEYVRPRKQTSGAEDKAIAPSPSPCPSISTKPSEKEDGRKIVSNQMMLNALKESLNKKTEQIVHESDPAKVSLIQASLNSINSSLRSLLETEMSDEVSSPFYVDLYNKLTGGVYFHSSSKHEQEAFDVYRNLFTRLMVVIKHKDASLKYLGEIIWSIKFGWYKTRNWSMDHKLNHALKIVKNKKWTSPLGFSKESINREIEAISAIFSNDCKNCGDAKIAGI